MSLCEQWFAHPPFALNQVEKTKRLLPRLNALSQHHRQCCESYNNIWRAFEWKESAAERIEDVPYLPVSLFKHRVMRSVNENEVYRTLLSSGTTSLKRSQVVLDRTTAQLQSSALAHIMGDLLGPQRLPMLLIDHSPQAAKDFSARQAGTIGMSLFGHSHAYALDMTQEQLHQWSLEHCHAPVFIFGFTHLVWQFVQNLAPGKLSLPHGIVVHGGGWKKLQDQAVSPTEFKKEVNARLGAVRCHDYYGMVEQVGSIFVECEEGKLHCPLFADVILRDPATWQSGDAGVVQVLSALPTSYPGHSLLTEDLAQLLGIDDCPCGRKGKTFKVIGRVPKSELRGCSNI